MNIKKGCVILITLNLFVLGTLLFRGQILEKEQGDVTAVNSSVVLEEGRKGKIALTFDAEVIIGLK